jgi:hypothetical protein
MAADFDRVSTSPAWRRHLAARTVARHAHDAKDLVDLLDMLGLIAAEGREQPGAEPTVPAPRKPAPRLDPPSACRLNELLRGRRPTERPHQTYNGEEP